MPAGTTPHDDDEVVLARAPGFKQRLKQDRRQTPS